MTILGVKSQTTSIKLQTISKAQIQMTKTGLKNERPTSMFIFFLFVISNFGNCDLFAICDLLFVI